ncbi:MAG: hypothetical protein WA004_14505 [Saprospiraceae bacterium]
MKKYQKNKAFTALPKTGLHSAGLAKLALTVKGRPCTKFAQTVASLHQARRSRTSGWGFIPAGFLTANQLMPDFFFNPIILKSGSNSQNNPGAIWAGAASIFFVN